MIRVQPTEKYDAIVIGSGIGGLTVASLLAQLGKKRVLVLEQHFKLGGYTHSFRRGDFEWDVGLHYVGEMHANKLSRRVMDLVTRKEVLWHRCGPIVERYYFPEGQFQVPDDPGLFKDKLIEAFPQERKALNRYFRDVRKCQGWIARFFFSKIMPPILANLLTFPGRKLAETITNDYLNRFESPWLKAILTGQWPDFGTKPAESAFAFHSAVAGDFFHGSFYPIGGAQEISKSVEKTVVESGGACLVNHSVTEVIVENGRAVGVRAKHKNKEVEFRAPIVVSNASALTTFSKFVPEGYCPKEKQQASRIKKGTSAVALFIGLKDDPRNHGFDDANYWIFNSSNHNRNVPPGEVGGAFLSFGSLRNPNQERHTAQLITFCEYDFFKDYASKPWMRRGEQYDAMKAELAEKMLAFVEPHVPNLRPIIDYQELSTPVTFEKFSAHPAGMVYGQKCDPDRLNRDQWRVGTSLPGLYLTGSDIGSPGINGSMMASIFTVVKILGYGCLPRIMGS